MDVLITRGGGFAERLEQLLVAAGQRCTVLPLVQSVPIDGDHLLQAWRALASGHFDWLVVTSATTAALLPDRVQARIAAVGPATAAALLSRGLSVDLEPTRASAEGLLEAWATRPGADESPRPEIGAITVLWPTSSAANPQLAQGLERAGTMVTRLDCYGPEPVYPDAADFAARIAPRTSQVWDAVVVTSGSAAEQVARLGITGPVVSSGAQTAADALALGLDVAAIAERPDADGLVEAVLTLADLPDESTNWS